MSSLYDSGIRPLIDQHLLEESKKVRDYGEYWSASSSGYCMRKNIFERLKVPPVSEDARKQRVFSSGHIFHEWLQRITKNAGISIAQELELQDEDLMIRGHFDDLVLIKGGAIYEDTFGASGDKDFMHDIDPDDPDNRSPNKLILYDYKTVHSKWFEYAKDRPMSHYNKMQLGTYIYMLRQKEIYRTAKFVEFDGKKFKYDDHDVGNLTEARILKISKDDLRLHEQQLLWTPALEKEIVEYWSILNGYWKNKKIPKCTCADFEKNTKTGVGFMANEKYNPYYYEGEPCSIKWYEEWKNAKV